MQTITPPIPTKCNKCKNGKVGFHQACFHCLGKGKVYPTRSDRHYFRYQLGQLKRFVEGGDVFLGEMQEIFKTYKAVI